MEENHNKTISPELRERLAGIRHLALDMDGTIYMGSTLFPFTIEFLDSMSKAGIGYSFLTNNPSRSVADYLKKLDGMGIQADEDNMYTTSLAAASDSTLIPNWKLIKFLYVVFLFKLLPKL